MLCPDCRYEQRGNITIRFSCPTHWNESRDTHNRELAKHLIDGHDETRTEDEIFEELTKKDGMRRALD
jgi:hypothetical protein